MASASSAAPTEALPAFPPLAALFLTYFDDLKGQTVSYYSSLPGQCRVVHAEQQWLILQICRRDVSSSQHYRRASTHSKRIWSF